MFLINSAFVGKIILYLSKCMVIQQLKLVTIPLKLERIRRLESDESCSVIIATHDIGLSTFLYEDTLIPICMAQRESVKGPQKRWTLQQPK
jgi:hypothetical protein